MFFILCELDGSRVMEPSFILGNGCLVLTLAQRVHHAFYVCKTCWFSTRPPYYKKYLRLLGITYGLF